MTHTATALGGTAYFKIWLNQIQWSSVAANTSIGCEWHGAVEEEHYKQAHSAS
jgi:hypothetical protein